MPTNGASRASLEALHDTMRSGVDGDGWGGELAITPAALGTIMVGAWGEYPRAGCGLVAARDDRLVRVAHGHSTPGQLACHFLSGSPGPWRQAAAQLEAAGLEAAAIYHTHLRLPAVPSPIDRDDPHPLRDLPQVIVSLVDRDEPAVRAWRTTAGRPTEVALRLAGPPEAAGRGR